MICFSCSLFLLSVSAGAAVAVVAVVVDQGQNATLNCSYDARSGRLSSCWSRGELPYTGMCGTKTIISSDGNTVTKQTSARYVLAGHLDQGDVSLTILNVSAKDTGTYGCRVDIPWKTDQKHHFTLEIRQAPDPTSTSAPHTTSAPDHVTSARVSTSSDHVTSSTQLWTSSGPGTEETRSSAVLLVCLLLLTLLCITTTVLFITMKKWRLFKKMSESLSPVQFSSTTSTLHLDQRSPPEENIYN